MADNRIGNNDNFVTLSAQGATDDMSFASKTGRDLMENIMNDTASIFNMLGGMMKGLMGMLGKGGKGGGGGGKGG